jgi:hypothetical protein
VLALCFAAIIGVASSQIDAVVRQRTLTALVVISADEKLAMALILTSRRQQDERR